MTYSEACTCPYTPMDEWTFAGGAYEPGSMQEPDPGCPQHGDGTSVCPQCNAPLVIEEEFHDQIGFEEQARQVHVVRTGCGHEIVTPYRTRWT